MTIYKRINLFVNFKALRRINLINIILKRISVAKELFLIEVQAGGEVFIPKDLS